ncbi:uncharacterized protein LOC114528500 [Dendronephthya gigantea]|uniref:uncharacterized protein LOC114528500 n=1 Tax=Dendronephthya gigantea TaxID=151771 RepID=UPI00106B4543|nr:uncharacterized protein LOC114528500 [Dendronephthya gigantea]
MYRRGDKYKTKPGRTYFFVHNPGLADGKFTKAVEEYCNALINTNGGILVFGVDHSERVVGFDLPRSYEDSYKLYFDAAIRQMRPTIHPHQYRLDVIYISYSSQAIFEIRMSAGEHEEIYENSKREMFIVKEKKLCGPLFPCEITQIVLAKYKEELASLIIENNQNHITSPLEEDKSSNTVREIEKAQPAKKSRWDQITWP